MRHDTVVACCTAVVLCSIAVGCSSPQTFSRGQAIPIGEYRISVLYPEIRDMDNRRALLVHLHCPEISTDEDMHRFQRRVFTAFSVRDSAGNRYIGVPIVADALRYSFASLPQSLHDAQTQFDSHSSPPDRTEWVVLAAVPSVARGFTLHIHNAHRRDQQPRAAVVDLGR
jgi:hypothetical protein